MQRNKEKQEIPCPTPGCWQTVKISGHCAACYSAFRRLSQKSMGEIEGYMTRVGRFVSRGKVALSQYAKPAKAAKPTPRANKQRKAA